MTTPEYQPYAPQEQPATPYVPRQNTPYAAEQYPTQVDPAYGQPEPVQPTYAQPSYAPPSYAPPAHAQPEPVQPTYAQPTYAQPTYAQPTYAAGDYAPPVSAPAGYPQVSAVPASGFPASAAPASGYPVVYPPVAPAAAKGGKGLFVTVTIVAVVCLVASAVLTVMFLNKSTDYDRANKLANDRATTITTDEAAIASGKDQLAAALAASTKLQSDLDAKTNQLTEVTHERDVIAKCVTDMNKFFDAAARGASNATLTKLSNAADKSCHEADKYIS